MEEPTSLSEDEDDDPTSLGEDEEGLDNEIACISDPSELLSEPRTPTSTFVARRNALCAKHQTPVLIAAGAPRSRNYGDNTYPFRAMSHFLYFVGASIPSAVLLLHENRSTLFTTPVEEHSDLWEGPVPSYDELKAMHQVDAVRPLNELRAAIEPFRSSIALLPTMDSKTCSFLSSCLQREHEVVPCSGATLEENSVDAALANAIVELRLRHDSDALKQLRFAA